LLDIK
jgi:dynein heavy chain